MAFHPGPPLSDDTSHPKCRVSVIVPARNEEQSLPTALNAMAAQVDTAGVQLSADTFEILLLLNNCTDGSALVARQWQQAHPQIALHICERTLSPEIAHVGTARRLLMDTAWHRLRGTLHKVNAILSTDSDTLVAPDWIVRNLRALERGADAVGGAIHLKSGDVESLPDGARRAYLLDRKYQQLVAELEAILDPQHGDPWPRHLQHFGASLACTPEIYARAGGMPPVQPLEDVAFVDALRRVDARLRHDPDVVVYTSSRMEGRVEIGLSQQLRCWQNMSDHGERHRVPSAAWLTHRFSSMKYLRSMCGQDRRPDVTAYPEAWQNRVIAAHRERTSTARFLEEIDCNALIETTFRGKRDGEITSVVRSLKAAIECARAAQSDYAVKPSVVPSFTESAAAS
ncbi:glycosyltransferase [Granulicella arctica]|uniref:glycosyltransferase n=1 Tax=Granulicella arctica TaxID=940613 RepID=UPI0021DFE8A6|nr:glycosyltransferase family 2 protein [Granulicella arctica]